jgi:NTE family protein
LKTRLDYPTKIPFYLEGGITLNRWDYFHSNNEPFFEDYRPGYVIQNEGNIRINVGFPVKTNSTFITSTSISNEKDEYHQSINFSRGDTNDVSKYNMFNYQFKFEKNTLNYPLFPTKGHYMHVLSGGSVGEGIFLPGSFQSMDGKEVKNISWFNLNIKNEKYLYLTERFYLGSLLELNLSTKEFFNNYTGTIILANSFKPTLLSKTLFLQDYRAFNFIGIGMLPGYNFSDQWGLKCEGFLFMPYRKILPDENNRAYYGKPFHHYSLMGGISLVYQSPFGPASLSVNYFEKIGKNLFIQFNFGYILFNNRGNQ